MLSRELLEILVCPRCKEKLFQDQTTGHLLCNGCNRTYPVVDGIPMLIVENAEPVM